MSIKLFRKLFHNSIVIFLAGAIFSASVDIAFGNVAKTNIGLFIALVALFILYVAATFATLHNRINKHIDAVSIKYTWLSNPIQGYEKINEIIHSAEHSIFVLTTHIPKDIQHTMPDERPSYMQAIEQNLQKHLQDDDYFVYKRILQSEKAEKTDNVLKKGLLNEEPPQTFEHCKQVFEMARNRTRGKTDVQLFVVEPVPSFPSMLIVDSRYVSFVLGTMRRNLGETAKHLEFAGTMIIEDNEGDFVKECQRIFDEISDTGNLVVFVEG